MIHTDGFSTARARDYHVVRPCTCSWPPRVCLLALGHVSRTNGSAPPDGDKTQSSLAAKTNMGIWSI